LAAPGRLVGEPARQESGLGDHDPAGFRRRVPYC